MRLNKKEYNVLTKLWEDKRLTAKKLLPAAFVLPHLIIFTIFFIIPFFYGIVISLYDWHLFFPDLREFVGIDNYTKILFDQESIYYEYFWNGLKNTFTFVLLSVPLLVSVPLLLASLINVEPKGYKVFRAIFYLPSLFSIATMVLIWRWVLNTNVGVLNITLAQLGVDYIPWLSDQPFAWISLVLMTVWWTIGGNMIIFTAALKEVPESLYEAGDMEGATDAQKFFYITIPSIRHQLVYITIMTTLASFNVFGQPQLATGGGPNQTTTVLMMYIRNIAFGGGRPNPGVATSMAVILGLIMITISIIQVRLIKRMGD
ncbi:MAG: sugar ABC transporter permease [Candidatus Izimaplasma sp.]|nr:sugar ABC transporter permease [Candidatus Izimaplasma bacterium]